MSNWSSKSSSKLTDSVQCYPSHRQTWTIEGDCTVSLDWDSETFSNVHCLTKWHVKMVLTQNSIHLCLHHHACTDEPVTVSYDFTVHDNNRHFKKIKMSKKRFTFSGNSCILSKSFHYLYDLNVSFKLHLDIIEVIGKNVRKDQESSLDTDVYRIWENRKYCDFVISVEGKNIPVHRLILAGASPVFEAMLDHNMLETSKARMVIEDYKVEVIEHLLQFVYTRRDPEFKSFSLDICLDLLRAANQYDIARLLCIISRYLISILSIENVAEILLVADQQSALDLKENDIEFICQKGVKVSEKGYLNKLNGEAELWEEIALRKLQK